MVPRYYIEMVHEKFWLVVDRKINRENQHFFKYEDARAYFLFVNAKERNANA